MEEYGDLFGSAVQLAARVCAYAKPDQIVTTQVVREECQTHQRMFIDLGDATLKGFDEPVRVHEVKWEDT